MAKKATLRIRLLNYLHYRPLSAAHEIDYKEVLHGECAVARELRWMAQAGLAVGTYRPKQLFDSRDKEFKEWRLTDAGEQAWDTARKNIIVTP